jgi:hypothetical protein
MKKSLIALFVAAFCFSSMAQVLVYDFSASFKRLDVKSVKYTDPDTKGKMYMDSAKVVSDKFTGYMVIDACKACGGAMEKSFIEEVEGSDEDGNTAVFYIVRGGDKAKKIYRAVSTFDAIMFGSKTNLVKDGEKTKLINPDKFTDALGDFEIPLVWKDAEDEKVGYEFSEDYQGYTYGFLGMDNSSEEENTLYGQGYGKVAKQSTTTKNTEDVWCGDEKVTYTTTYCWMVKNLSGSVVGNTNYDGHCGLFLFDVCDQDVTYNDAVLPGTFTLKLNNSLTFNKKAFRYANFAAAEEDILAKLKYAADDVIYIPEDGDGKDQSLKAGEVWGTIDGE